MNRQTQTMTNNKSLSMWCRNKSRSQRFYKMLYRHSGTFLMNRLQYYTSVKLAATCNSLILHVLQ